LGYAVPIDDQAILKLHADLWAAMVRDAHEAIDPLTVWQPLYADAIAAVLTRGAPADWARLAALLRERQPIHPMLLPALAEALEARGRNRRDGRRRKLTPIEELQAAREVRYLRSVGQSSEQAVEAVAQRLRVSESVVKRALHKHMPVHLRPSRKARVKTGSKF
jgi:uncharacterized protein YoaH (UPF0181 family)